MHAPTTAGLALVGHRYVTESMLAALRIDNTIDDREKVRRISEVIAEANARALELMRQHRRLAASAATAMAV
jgi:hypothetical protein